MISVRAFSSIACAIAVALACGACSGGGNGVGEKPSSTMSTVEMDGVSTFDVSDLRLSAGFATNIFFGTVLTQVGNRSPSGAPATQFTVKTLSSLKGSISGDVLVNQQGGVRDNKVVIERGDSLLEVGKTYLFVTRWSPEQKWYGIVPVVGHPLASPAEALLAQSRTTGGQQSATTTRWLQAIRDEVDPVPRLPDVSPGATPPASSAPSSSAFTPTSDPSVTSGPSATSSRPLVPPPTS